MHDILVKKKPSTSIQRVTLQTKSNCPLYCLLTLIYSARNRGNSEDFDAYRSQRPIIKTYLAFKMTLEVYQEWDAFMTQTVHFALWSGNTKPLSTLDHNRNSREMLKERGGGITFSFNHHSQPLEQLRLKLHSKFGVPFSHTTLHQPKIFGKNLFLQMPRMEEIGHN